MRAFLLPMTETEQRAAVIAEARGWLTTPYHHMARVKGGGVDCAQLLIAVYHAAGLVPDFAVGYYPPDWHLHRDRERYLEWVEKCAHPVARPKSADIAIWKFGRTFSHGAIVVDWPNVIHAYMKRPAEICDMSKEEGLKKRELLFYELNGWGGDGR